MFIDKIKFVYIYHAYASLKMKDTLQPAWKVGDLRFEPLSGLQVSKKHNLSSPLSVSDRRPGLEFRILCLEGSVISSSSGGDSGPV